jgi:hypothetical protein
LEILIHFFFSETEKYPAISASTDCSGKATFTLLCSKINRGPKQQGTDHDKRTTDTFRSSSPYKPLSATTVAKPSIPPELLPVISRPKTIVYPCPQINGGNPVST